MKRVTRCRAWGQEQSAMVAANKEEAQVVLKAAQELEQAGRMDEAAALYRRAFRLDPDLDKKADEADDVAFRGLTLASGPSTTPISPPWRAARPRASSLMNSATSSSTTF